MTLRGRNPTKGSLILLVMCLLTVLGIALASYLAVSNAAMKLSNRGYAKDVSFHLAEMGLERSLRMFNAGVYGGWTPDASPATTARRTLAIASSNYSTSGLTATVNLRVDHYKAAAWNAATAYTPTGTDMAWYRGVWFQCLSSNTNQVPPNATYWKSAPAAWSADANYNIGDIALVGGLRYVCTVAHANQTPPNAGYWGTGASVSAWSAATAYAADDVALAGATPCRCILAHTNQAPPNATYWISAPVIYSEGVATLNDSGSAPIKTQLWATLATAPLFPNAAGAATLVNLSSTGTVDSYNSVTGVYGGSNLGSSAVLAGGNTSGTAVTVASARVNGYVAAPSATTTPFAPLWTYGGTTILTSTPAPTTPSPRVDLTRVTRSPYLPQYDIQAVTGASSLPSPAPGSTYLPAYAYSLGVAPTAGVASSPLVYNVTRTYADSGGYYSGLYLVNSGDILTINGPVILNVTGDLYLSSGKIVIASTGSLEIYFTGELYLGNNSGGGIDNSNTKDPKKLLIVGTSTYNSSGYHYFWTSMPFYGAIYMPNAYLHCWNSGYNEQIYGALSASNIYFNHTVNLHYDTSLRTASRATTNGGVDAPYQIAEWRELTDPTERVTLP